MGVDHLLVLPTSVQPFSLNLRNFISYGLLYLSTSYDARWGIEKYVVHWLAQTYASYLKDFSIDTSSLSSKSGLCSTNRLWVEFAMRCVMWWICENSSFVARTVQASTKWWLIWKHKISHLAALPKRAIYVCMSVKYIKVQDFLFPVQNGTSMHEISKWWWDWRQTRSEYWNRYMLGNRKAKSFLLVRKAQSANIFKILTSKCAMSSVYLPRYGGKMANTNFEMLISESEFLPDETMTSLVTC